MPIGHPSPLRAGVQLQLLLRGLALCKARRASVIWTVHNLDAHEAKERAENSYRAYLRRALWSRLRPALDGWIVHSADSRQQALHVHPWLEQLPSVVIPHGHYRGEYPDSVSREEARRKLGLAAADRVLLCFGAVRPYRNVPELIEAFHQTPGGDLRLFVVGGARGADLKTRIERLAARDPRVRLFLRHVPADEVQDYFRACDIVVLPYRDILNSGAALLALSFDRPVLLPQKGSMADLQRSVGSDWVRLFNGGITPGDLSDAVGWACGISRSERAPLDDLDWSRLARQTLDFYERVRDGGE
jgi:glycosyltransferase involved in cell wall biosynthesis